MVTVLGAFAAGAVDDEPDPPPQPTIATTAAARTTGSALREDMGSTLSLANRVRPILRSVYAARALL
jgi:hypothetical protein